MLFTLVTARTIKIMVSLYSCSIFQISNVYDIPVLLHSFNDTAYKIVRSLWSSRNSWLRATWNANQMSPPNFYVLFIYLLFSILPWFVIAPNLTLNVLSVLKTVVESIKLFLLVGCTLFTSSIFFLFFFLLSLELCRDALSLDLAMSCRDALSLELCRDALLCRLFFFFPYI